MGEDSDDDALSVIALFKTLRTKEARRAAYHGLLDQLQSDEWRQVKTRTDAKSFMHDILGSLPLELVVRVCRRWNRLLSSSIVYRTALQSHGIRGQCEEISDEEVHSIFMQHAKRRLLLELGRPCSKAFYPARLDRLGLEEVIAYCHGRLAWAETDDHGGPLGLTLYCLSSGTLSRVFAEDREVPFHVRLSETAVAMATSRGDCHMFDFTTGNKGSFHLPSAFIHQFIIAGDRIAIMLGSCRLFLWDLRSQVTREVDTEVTPLIIALHPTEDKLTSIHLDHDGKGRDLYPSLVSGLVVTRYLITGTTITQHHPPSFLGLPHNDTWVAQSVCRVHSTVCQVVLLHLLSPSDANCRCAVYISYDPRVDEVSSRCYDLNVSIPLTLSQTCGGPTLVSNELVYYFRNKEKDLQVDPGPWIFNPDGALIHRKSEMLKIDEDWNEDWDWDMKAPAIGLEDSSKHILLTFGDSTFFGRATRTGFEVWCFDEHVHMPGEDPYYTQLHRALHTKRKYPKAGVRTEK